MNSEIAEQPPQIQLLSLATNIYYHTHPSRFAFSEITELNIELSSIFCLI
jgi:hypothetical protein